MSYIILLKMSHKNHRHEEEYSEYDEDRIRPPDQPVREQLIATSTTFQEEDYESQMERALQQSMHEYDMQQQAIDEAFQRAYEDETIRRRSMFEELLTALKRVARYDTQINEVFQLLHPVVEMFVAQAIDAHEVEEDVYNRIFGSLTSVRVKPETAELLQFLIQKKERN